MLGVIACARATRESEIITGALTLIAELFCCRPHERMEPVHSARESAERVADEVVTLYVRELMKENCAAPVSVPGFAIYRQHYGRLQESACERHPRVGTSEQAGRLVELESVRYFI
jgi:hypothetical protein